MSKSNPMHHDNVHSINGGELPAQPQQPAVSDTPLTSLNAMAGLVIGWHGTRIEQCLRMLEIPDGTEMQYEDADKPGEIDNIPMTGDSLKAFRVGVLTAMGLFETLPFVATEITVVEAQPDPATNDGDDATQG